MAGYRFVDSAFHYDIVQNYLTHNGQQPDSLFYKHATLAWLT